MPRPLPANILADTGGDIDAVRRHILDAAHRVVRSHGLAAASTRAIATEAGLGAGTLYNYFDDRVQLLAQSIHRRASVLTEPLTDLPSRAGTGTVPGNLRHAFRQASTVMDELVPLFAAAFSDPELLATFRAAATGHQGAIDPASPVEQYLLAEREIGRVRPDADCRAAASIFVSLCHDRAFYRFLFADTGRVQVPTKEIGFLANQLTPR